MPISETGPPVARSGAILVVDDELAVRLILARMLEAEGYAVRGAASAREALALLSAEGSGLSLVLSDIRMPGMSGVDLALEVRRSWPDLPIALMTAYEPLELSTEPAVAGIVLLRKPFTGGAVLDLVNRLARPVPVADEPERVG